MVQQALGRLAGWLGSRRPSLTRENPTAPASSGTAPSQLLRPSTPGGTTPLYGPGRPLPPFAPVPGLGTYSGGAARLPGSGAGPTGGWGGWEAGTLPRGSLSRQAPGCRGGEGEQRAHSPRAQPVASPGRWRKPPGPGRGQAQAEPPNHGLLFPLGCWRRKPAEQLPHSQLRVWRWRTEVPLRSPPRSCSISRAAPRPAAPSPVPLSRSLALQPGSGPPARHDPLPPRPSLGHLRPGARDQAPGPAPSLDPGALAPSPRPGPPSGAARSLGVPWRNPRPRPRSWCGRSAPCAASCRSRSPTPPTCGPRAPPPPRGKESASELS